MTIALKIIDAMTPLYPNINKPILSKSILEEIGARKVMIVPSMGEAS
jgi:hypothetical protein